MDAFYVVCQAFQTLYTLHVDGELACLYVLRHVQEPKENVDAISDVNNDTKDAQDAGFKET